MNPQTAIGADDFVISPRSRRANSASRGVLPVRRSDRGM